MGEIYKFQCPGCRRTFKANKDLGGRLKRCGQCRETFTIKRHAPAPKGTRAAPPEPLVVHDPELPIDQVFNALHGWQQAVRSLPGSFAREVTFGHFDPTYRITLDVTVEADGRQTSDRARRETADLPAELGDEARQAARKVVDLAFEHTSQLASLLADKPAVVREAAERLAKELRPPTGGRFVARRLVVEHLQVWKAHWVFHQSEGNSWFFGRPLRVFLPNPPRRSSAPAVLATLATLAAAGAVAWVFLVRPGDAPPSDLQPTIAPLLGLPKAPKHEPVQFAKDGVLQLEDGAFLRGSLERRGEEVVVRKGEASTPLAPWQIESLHVDAPVFLRGESRRLDDLDGRVKSARDARPAREILVGLFLEVHRQRERWARLLALCAPSELPGDPQKRIEALRAVVEKLLEPPAAPVVAAAPDAPKPPEPSPAVAVAAGLLRGLAAARDDAERAKVSAGLQALKGEKLPQSDLLLFASLYLSRSSLEAGLAIDRLRVKTAQTDSTFEGTFEKQGEYFARLRTASGQEVTAYREKDAWVAQLPGGVRVEGAQCTLIPAAATGSSERLRAAFDRLPPERWMTAPAADHLRAARAAAEPVDRKLASPNDRGLVLLRSLAAGHAGTAVRIGSPAEILDARVVLHGIGYAQTSEGRWERPDDRRAAQMGQLLRDAKAEDARALLPGPRGTQDFFGSYRSAAVQLQAPLRSVEDLDRAVAALDQSIGQAFTSGESRHLLALKGAVSGFGICASCGGSPAKICTTCRGKGTRTEACAACNGLGYKVTVGIGASGQKTCESCNGKPIRGTRPCERCEGKGTRSCAKCQGVTRLPAPADLSRTRPCGRCGGSGGHGDAVVLSCISCAGLGLQLVPAGAPDATLP